MYPVQISDDRFLVEFAPCEKGEFRETTYQETFVFDIVQTDDGRRHSIMKGDKVLAPTDIGSELYAPGTVIDGQERREQSKGGLYNIQHHTPHAQKKWFKISKFSVHVISIPDPYMWACNNISKPFISIQKMFAKPHQSCAFSQYHYNCQK